MPSFQDSAVIFFLALLLFGPKKLPELARQLGKLMGEFRRASNEFRMQMEDELRVADQEEQRKKIAAMESAAPVAPALSGSADYSIQPPAAQAEEHTLPAPAPEAEPAPTPLPIATAGDLNLMPPATGLPVGNSALAPMLDAIPHLPDSEPASPSNSISSHLSNEAPQHG